MPGNNLLCSAAIRLSAAFMLLVFCGSCGSNAQEGTFGHDIEILQDIDAIHVLKSGQSRVAVSGELQGRVFTSSSNGSKGRSYGWFRRSAISDGSFKRKFSSLGGEDRLWFGPQYGEYNVFFEPGTSFEDKHMQIAQDLDTLHFEVVDMTEKEIKSTGRMRIRNYQNFVFDIDVERKVTILDANDIAQNLGISLDENVSHVGFESETTINNIGKQPWKKENGLISMWILGCMLPTENTVAIIPTRGVIDSVTNYFTPLNDSRMQIKDGTVYYKADADYLNKIGIPSENTLPFFGSYSPELKLLTIVQFSFDDNDAYYMNSEKTKQVDPFGGDVINIFNDGKMGEAGPFGPFYELETSSSAKELSIGERQTHKSSTYHFEGKEKYLDEIAFKILGIHLADRVIF